MAFSVRVTLPFDWKWSKNNMWIARGYRHARRLSPEAEHRRALLARAIQAAITESGARPVEAPVFFRIDLVLPDHRGDAINCLDLVADGIENGLGIDDRWYALDGIYWRVREQDEQARMVVQVTQEWYEPWIRCRSCGIPKPRDQFAVSRRSASGRRTKCEQCSQP